MFVQDHEIDCKLFQLKILMGQKYISNDVEIRDVTDAQK